MSYRKDLFAHLPVLDTERLRLRMVTVDDASDMFLYASDPEVTRFTPWEPHQSVARTRDFLQDIVDGYAAGEVRSWAVVHKGDGRMIGTAGFLFWDEPARRSEIGYAMSRGYWGQGLMTEAVRAILRFGFEQMSLNRIEARCDSLNVGSRRVLTKSGMTHEGTLREQFVSEGELHDMMLFAILRREWIPH